MDSDSESDTYLDWFDAEAREEEFERRFRLARYRKTSRKLYCTGGYEIIDSMTNEDWADFGRDVKDNTFLRKLSLFSIDDVVDGKKITSFFSGLTRSSSIEDLSLSYNEEGFNEAGVRSMLPFIQNTDSLRSLYLDHCNLQSEGFNILLQAIRDRPIECLDCRCCGIQSINISLSPFRKNLRYLYLSGNNINFDGCRGLLQILNGSDSKLGILHLNEIEQVNDEFVANLVEALQSNTSLSYLKLCNNNNITVKGRIMLLKLLNDISSVEATLQSNHSLKEIDLEKSGLSDVEEEVQQLINVATNINRGIHYSKNASERRGIAGLTKVITTQLISTNRAKLSKLQGVNHSLESEINPLHLPELLSLVGRRHGQAELYTALKSSIAGVISVVDKRKYFEQQLAYHTAKAEEIRAVLAKLDEKECGVTNDGNNAHVKRRRMS